MRKDVLQKVILMLAAFTFCAFIVYYCIGVNSGIIAFGTLTPVLLLLALSIIVPDKDDDTPVDDMGPKEEDFEHPHVDELIDQVVDRRERLEEKTKILEDTAGKLEKMSQRVLALESENIELTDELNSLRDDHEGLNKELEATRQNLHAQEEKVKDATISILPITEGEDAKILDICEAAEKAVANQADAFSAAGIRVNIAKPQKAMLVKADARMMDALFTNIIDNTLKYMGRSGLFQITISDINEEMFVVLKDSGEGLDSEEAEHIFDLNYQGSNRVSGSGLGLAQARAIVEYYGGMIYARSGQGTGMGIYIHLPAAGSDGRQTDMDEAETEVEAEIETDVEAETEAEMEIETEEGGDFYELS